MRTNYQILIIPEVYIFLASVIILGGTFWIDYIRNLNFVKRNNYLHGVLYLFVSVYSILFFTDKLKSNPERKFKINFGNETIELRIKL
jgi:hypothetical protein